MGCGGAVPTATSTPSITRPFQYDELQRAERAISRSSSFNIAIVVERDGIRTTVEGYIAHPDRSRFVMQVPVDDVTNIEVETLLIESSQYTLYPDFQAWFDVGEAELSREDLRDFPYDLKELQQAANFGARVANDKTLLTE